MMDNNSINISEFNFYFIQYLILMLCMGMLAIEMAYESSLAFRIKKFLQFYNKNLIPFSVVKLWTKLLGKHLLYLFPIIIPVILAFKAFEFIKEVFGCMFCLSFHLGWLSLYFFMNFDIVHALLYAPMAIVFVYLIESLKRK